MEINWVKWGGEGGGGEVVGGRGKLWVRRGLQWVERVERVKRRKISVGQNGGGGWKGREDEWGE